MFNHSRLSAISLLVGATALLLFTGLGCKGTSSEVTARSKPIVLKYWRVFDNQDAFDAQFAAYRASHPNIQVEYRKFRYDEYQKALLDALAEDKGPDVLSLQTTWLGDWQPRLLPMPASITIPYSELQGSIKKELVTVLKTTPGTTIKQLTNDFIDTVAPDVVLPTPQDDPRLPLVDKIYGLPLSVDTLVLFYNRDMLNNAGIPQPAANWKEFHDQVKKLTRLDSTGTIIQSGAALGSAANVARSADIVSNLMMQNGAPMTDDHGVASFDKYPPGGEDRPNPPGAEALIFYTDFANPEKEVYTWNDKMPGSIEAFANGQTAYFFGYAYNLPTIRLLNKNLRFGTAPFPQIEGNKPLYFANYWVESVSNKTDYPNEAWDFVQFLTRADQAEKYLSASVKPTALRSLVNKQLEHDDLAIFASQLPSAKTWYHGTDIDATEKTFAEMIGQTLSGEMDPKRIIQLGATKVNQTIK